MTTVTTELSAPAAEEERARLTALEGIAGAGLVLFCLARQVSQATAADRGRAALLTAVGHDLRGPGRPEPLRLRSRRHPHAHCRLRRRTAQDRLSPQAELVIIQAYRTRVAPGDPGVLGVVIDAPPMNLIGPELVREGFAERARQELIANGETVRKRTVEIDTRLTPQEAEPVTLERASSGLGGTLAAPRLGDPDARHSRTEARLLRKVSVRSFDSWILRAADYGRGVC